MASDEDTRGMLGRTIRRWMTGKVAAFVDESNEVNATAMVEEWDRECSTGGATLDANHVAWEIAAQVAERENARRAGPR